MISLPRQITTDDIVETTITSTTQKQETNTKENTSKEDLNSRKNIERKEMLTIVLPTLNEEEAIGKVIDELKHEGYENILVVDGYSTDFTVKIAKERDAKVVLQKGKSWSHKNSNRTSQDTIHTHNGRRRYLQPQRHRKLQRISRIQRTTRTTEYIDN